MKNKNYILEGFNTSFWNKFTKKQAQIQMVIVYPKPGFEFVYLRLHTNPKIIKFSTASLINIFLMAKNTPTPHEF